MMSVKGLAVINILFELILFELIANIIANSKTKNIVLNVVYSST